MDINSLVSRYLLNNSEADFETVKNQMNELKEACFSNYGSEGTHSEDPSIFTIEDDISMDEFINIMSQASGKDVSEIEESAGLLFEILDSDENGEDGSLSASELKELFGSGDDVNKFTVINKIYNFSEEELVEAMEKMQTEEGYKDYAQEILDGNMSLEAIADVYGEDSDFYKSVKEKVDNGEGGLDSPGSIPDLSDDKIEDLAELIHNGERNLSDYSGIISEEDYAALETAVNELEASENAESPEETEETEETEEPEETGETESPETGETESPETGETESPDEVPSTGGGTEGGTVDSGANTTGNEVDFSNPENARAFVESFIDENMNTPESVIDWLLEGGIITEEDASLLRQAYSSSYSEEVQEQIDNLMATGRTYDEAVEFLTESGKITQDSSSGLNREIEKSITDSKASELAGQLHDAMKGGLFGWGTDDEQFAAIFNNDNLTSAAWVKIIQKYNEDGKSFITDVDRDFTGETQDEYQKEIANRLLEAAESGDPDAIELLCEEIYNATAGKLGTADEFIDAIINNASDEVLAKIIDNYPDVNNGSDIFSDIKGDFSFETEDRYIARLNEAYINYE